MESVHSSTHSVLSYIKYTVLKSITLATYSEISSGKHVCVKYTPSNPTFI